MLSKLQPCWNLQEYWEESWKLEETFYHSHFSEKPSANDSVKKSQGVIYVSKVGDRSRGQPEGSLFNSYNAEV